MKYKRTIIILSIIWVIIAASLIIDVAIQSPKISQYFIYFETGCDFVKLKQFVLKASEIDKSRFYDYFNNIYNNPPIIITEKQLYQVEQMLKISFIGSYNWGFLICFGSLNSILLIYIIYLMFIRRAILFLNIIYIVFIKKNKNNYIFYSLNEITSLKDIKNNLINKSQ